MLHNQSLSHKKHHYCDTLCWQNVEFYSVKPAGAYTSYHFDLMG